MAMTKGRDQAGNVRRRRRDGFVVEVDGFGIAVSQRASSSLETGGAAIAATGRSPAIHSVVFSVDRKPPFLLRIPLSLGLLVRVAPGELQLLVVDAGKSELFGFHSLERLLRIVEHAALLHHL